MPRGLFVTGTDTDVGKTVISAALMHRYRSAVRLRYWKPVQTGIEQDDDTAAVVRLGSCASEVVCAEGIRLRRPVSPHIAALESGRAIDVASLAGMPARIDPHAAWIVEGAGGVLVPLNPRETMVELIARLQLPAVVVARTRVGTINHTLLTVEALRRRGLAPVGVVMVGSPDPAARAAIEDFGDMPVLGEMPPVADLTAAAVRDWSQTLDPAGQLLRYLS
jgi:dethiobiotin synthase